MITITVIQLNSSNLPYLSHPPLPPDLSLPSLLLSLRPISTSLLSSQKTSLQARKALADQTREFKKQPASDQLESFKPLLKSYQAEIDSLTKRSKASENAFFDVLEKLEGVRDPLRALEVVLVSRREGEGGGE